MSRVLAYLFTLATFGVLDFIWLGLVARGFYQAQIGSLLLAAPNWGVAVLFYAAYIVGVVIFAVVPALDAGSWLRAAILGGLFGFFCYATYDLTNLATLKGWTVSVALLDIAWGIVVTAAAAAAGYALTRTFGPG
ncbi:MAG: DUF2177 family protein [Betaproteobacteria bacterium]